jgi:LPXTG-motif cell wall-anchored protein
VNCVQNGLVSILVQLARELSRPFNKQELTLSRPRTFIIATAVAASAALAGASSAASAFADEAPGGSAYALSLRAELLDAPLVEVDPVPRATYPQGEDKSVVKIGPTVGGLVSAKVLNASSNKAGTTLTSKASLAEVTVKDILHAELVTADCSAVGANGASGKSSIAKLTVLGQNVNLAAAANAKVDVLGVPPVTNNEQSRTGHAWTVNAVHVTIGGTIHGVTKADIVLAQARCVGGAPSAETSTATETSTPTSATEPTSTTSPTTTSASESTTTTSPTTDSSSVGVGGNGSENGPGGIDNAANSGDLAETGVSGVLPLLIGAVVLLAAGAAGLFYTRRKRGTAGGPASE